MRYLLQILFTVLTLIFSNTYAAEVPVLENPMIPPAQRTVVMEEVWRIGDNEDEDFLFGVIGQVLEDEQGFFYLLDTQQYELFKFSPEGEYLKTVSRNGEGPGEINMCYQCQFWDTQTIACNNGFPQQLVLFDLEGIPERNIKLKSLEDMGEDHHPSLFGFSIQDGVMVGTGGHFLFENGQQKQLSFLSVFDREGQETYCFDLRSTGRNFRKPITVNEEKDFRPYSRWAQGKGGEVYCAPRRDEYYIEVRDLQGKLLREITRPWKTHKRSREEKEKAKNRYSFSASGMDIPPITYKISDHDPAIAHLSWVENHLWVYSTEGHRRSLEDGYPIVDIFSPEGKLIEERTYKIPQNPEEDNIHWLDEDHAVVVTNVNNARRTARDNDVQFQVGEGQEEPLLDEDAILEVILYRAKH